MIFELQGKLIIDESKPTIVFIDKGDQDNYTHIYGTARIFKKYLQEQYNIITFGAGCNLKDNYYEVKRNITLDLLRKKDCHDYIKKNALVINNWFKESFKDLPVIDYIILGTDDFFRLPLTKYTNKNDSVFLFNMDNEYFDYVGDDKVILQKIDKINDKIIKNYDKYVSPIAFSTKDYNLFMRAIQYINDTNRLKHNVIALSIDPAIYKPFFQKTNIPSKFYYFAEDKRGTRIFNQLDIAQIQHIIYDNKYLYDDWEDTTVKTHNMFFAGTIFQGKGTRKFIWNEFLKDIKTEKCSYYIPLRKNGIIKKKNGIAERHEELLKESEFNELYNEVINHPNFKGSIIPSELNTKTKRYKYGMVFRCVSINDSLNFRPVLYTYMNIVPFLDKQYDPEYLQIPKHIQDKLLVTSAKDIDDKIEFYNNNDDARIEILNELNELFKINEYINEPEKMIIEQIKKIIPEFN